MHRARQERRRADPAVYGDAIADHYDAMLASMAGATADAVAFLAGLAPRGRALELGVGTGRVALPLAAAGLGVHGIDASPRMLELLRAKPGAASVRTTLGDFADVDVEGAFDLAYVVFNTLYALPSQQRQVDCLRNVARVLVPGGAFVVEVFVPPWPRYGGQPEPRPADAVPEWARVTVTRHDPLRQTLDARQPLATPEGPRVLPVRLRYVWPSELDLMARLAGLRPVERFGGWRHEPFGAASPTLVTVYEALPGSSGMYGPCTGGGQRRGETSPQSAQEDR